LGSLTDSTNGTTGKQAWTFSAADHFFDYLREGQQVTLTYTVQIDDHHGGVVTQNVAITIDGSSYFDAAPVVDLNNDTAGRDNVIGYQHGPSSPVLIAEQAVITDTDSSTLHSMTITLTNALDASAGSGGINIKEFLSLTAA